ncbi:MAG: hypothetical protein ACM3QS_16495 [Bacteroidota bacterium]
MRLTSRHMAIIVVVFLFGGIGLSSALGWWQTESTKQPVTFTDGEFAGLPNPADIRGSYTFGDIAGSFDVNPATLARAFGVTVEDPAAFAVKDLESLYADSAYEVGTASLRLFVAYYTGLPFDTAGQEIFLPQTAVDILLDKGNLDAGQLAYLENFTVPAGSEATAATQPAPEPASTSEVHTVRGKMTFGELLSWGVGQEAIKTLIGAAMPDPAMTLKDYASANDLDFETLKGALQGEVDRSSE